MASLNWVLIGSSNGFSLAWHQAITWANDDVLSFGPLGTNISEIWINMYNFSVNTLRLRQNCRHFADDIFKCIFLNENVWISLQIWLKFVPKVPINNIPPLVQIMAWRRSGDKPLFEPMMISLLTHICVTRPQWWPFCSGVKVWTEDEMTFYDFVFTVFFWFLSIQSCIWDDYCAFNMVLHISMVWCKTAVTPLLMHWSYCSLALSLRYKKWRILKKQRFKAALSERYLRESPIIEFMGCVCF